MAKHVDTRRIESGRYQVVHLFAGSVVWDRWTGSHASQVLPDHRVAARLAHVMNAAMEQPVGRHHATHDSFAEACAATWNANLRLGGH